MSTSDVMNSDTIGNLNTVFWKRLAKRGMGKEFELVPAESESEDSVARTVWGKYSGLLRP